MSVLAVSALPAEAPRNDDRADWALVRLALALEVLAWWALLSWGCGQ